MTLAVAQPGLDLLPVLGPQAPSHPQLATRRKTLQCVWGGGCRPSNFFFFSFIIHMCIQETQQFLHCHPISPRPSC
jgi:hypothetical protein